MADPARAPLLYMAHHADDFGLHIELLKMDAFPYGIFMRKPGARKNIIDVDYYGGVLIVLRSDEAAALERDSHSLLETGFHQIINRLVHFVVVGRLRLAFDPERQRRIMDHRA